MRKISDKQLDELRRIHAKLAEFLAAFDAQSVVVAPEVAAAVEDFVKQRICLACRLPIPPDDRPRRGLDSGCYSTTRARIARGETTEIEQIQLGKMAAETKRAGRPAKQDRKEQDKAVAAAAVETLKSANKKKGKP